MKFGKLSGTSDKESVVKGKRIKPNRLISDQRWLAIVEWLCWNDIRQKLFCIIKLGITYFFGTIKVPSKLLSSPIIAWNRAMGLFASTMYPGIPRLAAFCKAITLPRIPPVASLL